MFFKRIFIAGTVLLAVACAPRTGIRRCAPQKAGMDASRLALIDSAVCASIAKGDAPGAVVGIVHNGALVYEKAFGNKSLVPAMEPMTVETMFDLASLSKCLGTTISLMQLVEKGKVRLTDPVSRYIPGFKPWISADGDTVEITVQHLLTHSSGLDAYVDMPAYLATYGPGTPQELVNYIATCSGRNFRPGTKMLYSCLNFVTVQAIIERVSGERLCDYTQREVFDALGLKHTCYFPLDREPSALIQLCAPTEVQEDGLPLQGVVHDPIARLINCGNSGNAGVFSNVEDLAVISAALLNGGSWNGRRILSPQTVRKMFEVPAANCPSVARALGWDTYYLSPYTSGDIFELEHLRGHTGYTGTSIILDPDTSTAVIILTNRVHPTDTGSVARLRGTVASIAASAIM